MKIPAGENPRRAKEWYKKGSHPLMKDVCKTNKSRFYDTRRNKQFCVIPIVYEFKQTNDILVRKTESYIDRFYFSGSKDDFPSAFAFRFVSSIGCTATVFYLIRKNTFSLFSRACASVISHAHVFLLAQIMRTVFLHAQKQLRFKLLRCAQKPLRRGCERLIVAS